MDTNRRSQAQGYNRFKQHQGKSYSGMPVGRAHKWYYDQGEWRERKLTPDEWEISYQTTKRRAARAPDESGAPVGTGYNWLIVSHQRVDKLDANSYLTCMEGKKFKVAHKRASKDAWSASEKAQRKQVVEYLEQVIEELKQADDSEPLPYSIGEHEHIYGLNLRTKAELLEMAKDYDIAGTSKMKRAELLEEVKAKVYQSGALSGDGGSGDGKRREKFGNGGAEPQLPKASGEELRAKTKDDLYKLASKRNIDGRSKMNKDELAHALASQRRHSDASHTKA